MPDFFETQFDKIIHNIYYRKHENDDYYWSNRTEYDLKSQAFCNTLYSNEEKDCFTDFFSSYLQPKDLNTISELFQSMIQNNTYGNFNLPVWRKANTLFGKMRYYISQHAAESDKFVKEVNELLQIIPGDRSGSLQNPFKSPLVNNLQLIIKINKQYKKKLEKDQKSKERQAAKQLARATKNPSIVNRVVNCFIPNKHNPQPINNIAKKYEVSSENHNINNIKPKRPNN